MFNRYLQFRTVLGAGGVFLDGGWAFTTTKS